MKKSRQSLLSEVLQQLEARGRRKPKRNGEEWLACCPAHNDSTPSLSVSAGRDGIVLNCHAGCEFEAIAAALGMKPSELFYDQAGHDDSPPLPPLQQLAAVRRWALSALTALGAEPLEGEGRSEVRFPMKDAAGTVTGWRKRKADGTAYAFRNGTTAKVLTEKGGSHGLFCNELPDDAAVLCCEGEADAAAALAHGAPAVVATPGANPGRKVLKYAQQLLANRNVVLAPDPDEAGERWREMMARTLHAAKCSVSYIPPLDADLDDRLGRSEDPEAELQELVRAAQEWSPRTADPVDATASNAARLFLEHVCEEQAESAIHDDRRHFAFHRDEFYEYTGKGYRLIREGDLEARVSRFIEGRDWIDRKGEVAPHSPSRAYVRNVTGIIRGKGLVPGHLDQPVWKSTGTEAKELIVLENGILNVRRTFQNVTGGGGTNDPWALEPHTPDLFTTASLDYAADPAADCPRWMSFLDRVLPDKGAQDVLQRWAGYLLLPTQAYQKILLLIGEGGNGKSVVLDVFRELIGPQNCTSVPLEELHRPHALQPLVGKHVNFATEWGYVDQIGLDTLKKVSGGDGVTINPKYKDPFETWLPTRFMVATNEVPRLRDRSKAIWRRLMVMPFEVEIPEEEQIPKPEFVAQLCEELPGIFTWALAGLFVLWEEGGFDVPEKMQAAATEVREDSNPAATWCVENLITAPGGRVILDCAYDHYKEYCRQGNFKPLNKSHFSREVRRWYKRETGENADCKRRRIDGQRKRVIRGCRTSTEEDFDLE